VHLTKRKALFLFFRFLSPSCLHSYDSVLPLGRGGTVALVDLLLSLGCGREGVLERERSRERERDLCCPRLFLFLVFEQQQKNSSLSLLHSSILILRCLARGRVLPLSE